MIRSASVLAFMACVSAMACSVTTGGSDGPGSGTDGSSSGGEGTGASSGNPGSSSGSSGTPASPTVDAKHPPPAASSAAPVEINATCPAFAACDANPIGTYDYTSGCIGDVFADARKQCPAMQAVGVTADVVGSITFDGVALARNVTADVSGTLVFPADCTLGQCAEVESALKSGFDSASCTAQSGGCSCVVKKKSVTNDYATYSIDGSTLTTSGGDTYDLCEKSGTLSYSGKSAGAETGSFSLAKR